MIISLTITAFGVSDLMFRSPSFKNRFCSFIVHFSGLITIRFVLDPALNVYFDLTIRGTDTVCIDWTLQVLTFTFINLADAFIQSNLLLRNTISNTL